MKTRQLPVRKKRSEEQGFTLLEILVVLAIIAVISSLVAPRLFNQLDRSKITTAEAQVRSLRTGIDTLRLDLGRYPTDEEGLRMLVEPPNDPTLRANWFGPYIDGGLPADPWGNPYRYEAPERDESGFTKSPRIFSYGADNSLGGSGMDADIFSVSDATAGDIQG